jgi:molybdopterin/thiamine biosynthesis adenylyltransferase
MSEIGPEGQSRLFKAKVLIIGMGGLGSPAALYLASAGVGTIGVLDADKVKLSNLQRQIIHNHNDLGKLKTVSAKEKMLNINPTAEIITHQCQLNDENAKSVLSNYDFIIECTDNFSTKYLVNDNCVLNGFPFSIGGVLKYTGQTVTVVPGKSACYRCLFPVPPSSDHEPSCASDGILGPVVGIIGSLQALEAVKYITGTGELLLNALLSFDGKTMEFHKLNFEKSKECPVCINS